MRSLAMMPSATTKTMIEKAMRLRGVGDVCRRPGFPAHRDAG
jgi:hypothetical protein